MGLMRGQRLNTKTTTNVLERTEKTKTHIKNGSNCLRKRMRREGGREGGREEGGEEGEYIGGRNSKEREKEGEEGREKEGGEKEGGEEGENSIIRIFKQCPRVKL